MDVQKQIKLIKNGDGEAFGRLYDEYVNKIYNFIYYKTHHKETAEDITSTVFMKAWEKIGGFQGEFFSAWLYAIARNSVIDYYRAKKIDYNIEDAWDISGDSNIAEDADTKISIDQIKEYLKNFSGTERDIIIMRVWQELSYQEIAQTIGKTEDNCKVIFSRTIKKLKQQMPAALFIAFLLSKL